MRRLSYGMIGIACLAALGCLHAPVLWSPDGQWLAYTVALRPARPRLEPGWLFATRAEDESGLTVPPREPGRSSPLIYRVWATRAESRESVLLEESRGPLTSPCWSPDGQALAFGRLVPEDEGRARFEVVVQEAPDRQRVVLTRPISEFHARADELPGLALAWSPDGRYLAVPLIQQKLALGVIRADNGRILKVIEDAYLPSWSPDGSKLAFIQGGEPESLRYIDHNFGPPRPLAELGQSSQAPVWARDGRSLLVVARRLALHRREPPSPQMDLLRVHVESGKIELVTTLYHESGDRENAYHGSSFCFDREGHVLFHVSDVEGMPAAITEYHPRTGETVNRFHPIDTSIKLGALAVSPDGKTLAFRVGSPGELSTPALYDLTSKRVTPLVPNDSARAEWTATLIEAARNLLRAQLPTEDAAGRQVERPTLLAVPGELPNTNETAIRLRNLGRIGRSLCERRESGSDVEASSAALAEARLFFDYLCEDYPAALEALDALEPHLTTSEQRLRLLGVRAQVFLGLKRTDQALKTIAFLRSIGESHGRAIEETPLGPELSGEEAPSARWADYLSERVRANLDASQSANEEVPLGHRNPDNPNADFVPGPAGGPIPFAPMIREAPRFMPLFPEFEVQIEKIEPDLRPAVPAPPPSTSPPRSQVGRPAARR